MLYAFYIVPFVIISLLMSSVPDQNIQCNKLGESIFFSTYDNKKRTNCKHCKLDFSNFCCFCFPWAINEPVCLFLCSPSLSLVISFHSVGPPVIQDPHSLSWFSMPHPDVWICIITLRSSSFSLFLLLSASHVLMLCCLVCVWVVCPHSRSPWWRGGHVAQVLLSGDRWSC